MQETVQSTDNFSDAFDATCNKVHLALGQSVHQHE